jgi:adenosylcobinamide-GDP ribazoletransferase
MIYVIARFPPARADGLGSSVQGRLRTVHLVVVSSAVALAVAAVAGVAGLCGFLLVGIGAQILGGWWTRDLGGLTGDTYGAICELTEVIALATLTAVARFAL